MSTRRVLVLGAGSSCDLKLPQGDSLLRSICPALEGNCPLTPDSIETLRHHPSLTALKVACRCGTFDSVDQMMRKREELRELAAAGVAAALLKRQIDALIAIHDGQHSNNWRTWLYKHCIRDGGPWHNLPNDSDELTVVTFNYDMLLEMAIAVHLAGDYGLSFCDAWHRATQLPILHVHGRLDLGDCTPDMLDLHHDLRGRKLFTLEELLEAGKGIRAPWDAEDAFEAAVLMRARRSVRLATHVAFFGFGFLPENLVRIGMVDDGNDALVAREVMTTGHMSDDQRRAVQARIRGLKVVSQKEPSDIFVRYFLKHQIWQLADSGQFSEKTRILV